MSESLDVVSVLEKMTPQQRREMRLIVNLNERPKTEAKLWEWIRDYTGYEIPRAAVCDGHVAPMSVVWEIFSEQITDMILLASRTSGKTVNLAILHHLLAKFYPEIETASLGAILEQSNKCISYLRGIVKNRWFSREVYPPTTRTVKYRNGSQVQVLTATKTGVNAPHPHVAIFDEVDLMEQEILDQAFSMAKSDSIHRAVQILASSRKSMTGMMQSLLNRCRDDAYFPFKKGLRSYCVFEVLQQCTLRNCDDCKRRIRADGVSFYDRCQKKAQQSHGFMLLTDAFSKFSQLDPMVSDLEWFCLRAEKAGLVFPRFDEGKTVHEFDVRDGWRTYVCCDFGFGPGHPFCAYYVQIDPSDNIWVLDELFGEMVDLPVWIERIKRWVASKPNSGEESRGSPFTDDDGCGWPMFRRVFADAHGDQEIRDMRGAGLRVEGVLCGVDEGLKSLRKWVNGVHGDFVHPRLHIHPRCRQLIRCLSEMHFDQYGKPDEKGDDPADAMRYLLKGAGYMDKVAQPAVTSVALNREAGPRPPTSGDRWKGMAAGVNRPARDIINRRRESVPTIGVKRGEADVDDHIK